MLVPLGPHAAAPFLAGRFTMVPHDGWYDASRPQYLMLMMREAWFTPRLRRIAASERPIFTVRRQGSTLLADLPRRSPRAGVGRRRRADSRDLALLESRAMAGSSFTVLVATDFSPTAEAAVQWGKELARARGGKLVLVHAVDLHGPLTDFLPSPADLDEQVRAAASARLDEAAAALREEGLEVEARLETGVASQAVVRAAGEIAPDLVVQGSRGLTPGLSHLLLGSTAQRIVQHSPRPVLTVHPGDRDRHAAIRHVLVPTDFSDDARARPTPPALLVAREQDARLTLAPRLPPAHRVHRLRHHPDLAPLPRRVAAVADEKLAEAALAPSPAKAYTVETVAREGYPARGHRRQPPASSASTSSPWAPTAAPASATSCSAATPNASSSTLPAPSSPSASPQTCIAVPRAPKGLPRPRRATRRPRASAGVGRGEQPLPIRSIARQAPAA